MTSLIEQYKTDHAALVRWVCQTYGVGLSGIGLWMNPHRLRREEMATRLRLYRGKAIRDVEQVIELIYENAEYKATLKKYVPIALEQNVSQRIVNEVASLYDRPCLRIFPDVGVNTRFHEEEKRVGLHETFQEAQHLLMLLNELLWWQYSGVDGRSQHRLITPDEFDAIPHAQDRLVMGGVFMDVEPMTILKGEQKSMLPHYEIWDDTYRYLISGQGFMVNSQGQMVDRPEEHGLGRIPGILMHSKKPTDCLMDSHSGSDITSAHLGCALLEVMVMRLSKSQGERQPVLQGNLANMVKGQAMNGERPLILPPEVIATMLEMKTDPDHYLAVKKDKLSSVANSYGMSYEQLVYQETGDSASGKAYVVRREKLTEIRREQRRRWVNNEHDVARLMDFDPTGEVIDFQEIEVPAEATEKVALLKEKMPLGLDSPVAFLMREDPDLSRNDAIKKLESNLRDYAALVVLVRSLNMPSEGGADNPGASPQQNGAMNGGESKQLPSGTKDGNDYSAHAKEALRAA